MLGCHGQQALKGQRPARECAGGSSRCSPCEPDKSKQLVCGARDTRHRPDRKAEQAAELVMTREVVSSHPHSSPQHLKAGRNPRCRQETLQVHSSHPSRKEVKNKSCLLNTSQHGQNTHSICHFPGRELQDRSAATESCFPSLSIHLAPLQPLLDHSCTFLGMAKASRSSQEPPGIPSLPLSAFTPFSLLLSHCLFFLG